MMSVKGPPPIEISSTIPSNPDSRLKLFLNVRTAEADVIGNGLESSHSSETQFGSFTNAAFGGVSAGGAGVPALLVTHGSELAQSTAVVAVHAKGNAGAVTPSKFSAQGIAAGTKVTLPIKPLGTKVGAPGTATPP